MKNRIKTPVLQTMTGEQHEAWRSARPVKQGEWSVKEEETLKRDYCIRSTEEIAIRLMRSVEDVEARLTVLREAGWKPSKFQTLGYKLFNDEDRRGLYIYTKPEPDGNAVITFDVREPVGKFNPEKHKERHGGFEDVPLTDEEMAAFEEKAAEYAEKYGEENRK